MESFEKNNQSPQADKKKGSEFKDGFLHVYPQGEEENKTGVVKESPEGLIYVKRDGTELNVSKEKIPGNINLPDGFLYLKTENMPPELRGFIAVLEKCYKEVYINQDFVNEESGEKKSFVPPKKDVGSFIDQNEEKLSQEMAEKGDLDESLDIAEKIIAKDLKGEKKKTFIAWKKFKGRFIKGAIIIGLSAVVLASLFKSGQEPNQDLKESAEIVNTVDSPNGPDFIEGGGEIDNDVEINNDAKVRSGEGVSHVIKRQLEANNSLAEKLGYDGSQESLASITEGFGYIGPDSEVRASYPGIAYQLVETPSGVEIYEFDVDGNFVESKKAGSNFEDSAQQDFYEYNYKK